MKQIVKYVGMISIVVLCVASMVVTVSAVGERSMQFVPNGNAASPYGYYNYNSCNSGNGLMGCDASRYPGSTEYSTKWIPGHWMQAQTMVPGRWVYQPMWVPGYPTSQYRWIQGFWQTTGYNTQPDVSVWGAPMMPNNGCYGMQCQGFQQQQPSYQGGGYFDAQGIWHP